MFYHLVVNLIMVIACFSFDKISVSTVLLYFTPDGLPAIDILKAISSDTAEPIAKWYNCLPPGVVPDWKRSLSTRLSQNVFLDQL